MASDDDKTIELKRTIHLGQVLGEGGMGRVVEGFTTDHGQHLAVKMLHPEHAGDAEMDDRFDEEIALMTSIDHPGSLPIYGSGRSGSGARWYAMKKVDGQTLTELLAERGDEVRSVPWRQRLLGVLLDVCETIGFAHEVGVVHRDLKPDNILVDRHGSVYVIDWGLAKRVGRGGSDTTARTLPGKVMGSPGYMAPEQAEGQSAAAGPEADVFALGSILYEVLTGKRPFGGGGGREEILGAIHRDPEPPRRANWLLPRSISAVCLRALAKDPSRRYPDARALAADLRAHLEGRAVSAVRPNLAERLRYAARRKPVWAATAVALALAAGAVAAFITGQVWIDERLADKSLERLETIDHEIGVLVDRTSALRDQLAAPGLPDAERRLIEKQLSVENSRWLLAEFAAFRLLGSVAELRFIHLDEDVSERYRERLFRLIENSIERDSPAFATALTETVLDRHERDAFGLELSGSDLLRLRELSARAREMTGLPEKTTEP